MNKVIVAGSINMDIVVQTERHPKPGETIRGSGVHFIPGGKGANQAVAASRLGGDVSFLAKTGQDSFGEILRAFLSGERLDIRGVTTSETAPTGTALITVDKHSENAIVVVPGSNAEMSAKDLSSIRLDGSEVIVSQFEIPQDVVFELFKMARAVGATTILNPAPALPCSNDLFMLVDYLVVNETEAAFFTEAESTPEDFDSAIAQANRLRTDAEQVVVVTLGAKGAVLLRGNEKIRIPGHKVRAVDTTGAGDCFVGALAVALAEDKTLSDALQFANAAAAVSVQRLGASASLPIRDDVDSFLLKQSKAM